jgi:hypothetical protein
LKHINLGMSARGLRKPNDWYWQILLQKSFWAAKENS